MITHPIKPLYDNKAEILILGSFPSVKSREEGFFYGHPQNRFWKVMARICKQDTPTTVEEKTKMILNNHFALWDVIHSCEITGSADSTIKNVTPNDLSSILNNTNIKGIFVNGKKAEALYNKYVFKKTGIKAIVLPSTSPANASWSEDRLFEFWNNAINELRNEE
ncbi:MAG: DNA-deoxyinosine glycosylase [Clostridiales bacterium]|nr:DNA-deoxyinosine glycosylase [Clostridiales bacterium]